MRKVYFENYRFSEDLDFTMLKNSGRSDIEQVIKKTIHAAKRDSGINFYDSDDYYSISNVYSIREIIVEKIRSLFERTRARDIYDLWFISKNIDMAQAFEIFPAKCAIKKISPDFDDLLYRKQVSEKNNHRDT